MARHMLLQLPLLLVAGSLIAGGTPKHLRAGVDSFNAGGVPGTLLAAAIIVFWMVPRALDESLISNSTALAKYVSLPMAGAALTLSWRNLGIPGRLFFAGNASSMLFASGALYVELRLPLCSAYALQEQMVAGYGLTVAAFIFVVWSGYDVIRRTQSSSPS